MPSARGLVLTLLALFAARPALADPPKGGGAAFADCQMTVVRAFYTERAMVDRLAEWTEPWEVHHDRGYVVVGVDTVGYGRLLAEGFRVEVDEKRTEKYCRPAPPLEGQRSGIAGYPCYASVEETYTEAQAMAAAHPGLATLVDIGDSWEKTDPGGLEGYDLLLLKLTNSAVAGTPTGTEPPHGKPRLLVTAAIHAREYATAGLALDFARYLLNNYGVDPDATWLLDEHEVHILLQHNPDGRKHAEAGSLWRKNTDDAYCSADPTSIGADLNRNYSYQWACCGGSSSNQCSETYHGPSAASEPEVQAVQAYARSIFPDQKGPNPTDPAPTSATGVYLDLHSYGALVLWPWGFTSTVAPNGAAMQTLGRRFAYFNGYTPEQSIGLYPTDGATDDFAYGDLGIAAFTVEVGDDFFQDCPTYNGAILPTNLPALIFAAKVARTPYVTPSGPRVTSVVSPAGTWVAPGAPVEARAVVDDLPFSSINGTEPTQNITAAEVYLDAPPWQQPAPTPIAMAAADGSFNSKTETVVASVPTAGLADGRHILYFRGQDASGSWGAVSAAFFWVLDPATAPHLQGVVRDAVSYAPLAATVSVGPFSTSTNPSDGTYDLMAPAGTYDAIATAADHASVRVTGLVLTSGTTTTHDFLMPPYLTVLSDDVESGNIGWTAQPPWAITTESYASPSHSWTDSPGGNYGNNRDVSLTSPLLDLTGYSGVRLEFQHQYVTESGYDYCYVEYSTNGGSTWTAVATYNGTQSSWQPVQLELGALDGAAQARIRFRLKTDVSVTFDGWHVDDIVVRAAVPVPDLIFRDGFESPLHRAGEDHSRHVTKYRGPLGLGTQSRKSSLSRTSGRA